MPHIARYDSWKLADVITPGFRAHWTVSPKHSMFTFRALRPDNRAVSLSTMNRKALMMEGDEPVITE